ncbi:MAG: Gfo/Idh/MocA family oxidoreductase [Trueperaceae bacterium]
MTVALIGAGNRGAAVYARYLRELAPAARLVAVADPDASRRDAVADQNDIPAALRFTQWQDLLERERLADALVIATPDLLHVEPALAALARGYHLLLEKPIAPTRQGVEAVAEAAAEASGTVTVSHVLRYSDLFTAIKRLLDSGRIGELVSIQHTENIGYWHFAHSYVRGNWRREADSSPMILAKACHDLDLLRWLVGEPCLGVASYGGLHHFRRENAPAGSTDRCTGGCAVERSCPYSAIRIYEERFCGQAEWPNSVMAAEPEPGQVRQALETGPYGRCVYRCDNDVADNQVVALSFGSGVSANLTVSAFTEDNTRTVHLMGTHGELHGHMGKGEIELNDFSAGTTETIRATPSGHGHSGADAALVRDFVARLRGEVTGPALTDLRASIESHRMAFAAEESRREGTMISLSQAR